MNDIMITPIMEAVMVPKDQYHEIVNYSESHADFRTFLPNVSFTDYGHSCEMMEKFIRDGIRAIANKGYGNDQISLATQKFVCESAELWKTHEVYTNRILQFMESAYRVPEKMKEVREKAIAEHPEYADVVNYMVTKYLEEYAVRASNEMGYIVEFVQMKNDLPLLMEMNSLVSNGYYLPEALGDTLLKLPGMILQMLRKLMNGLNYTLTETSKRFANRILANNQINEEAIKQIYQLYQAKSKTGNQAPIMYPDPQAVNEKRKAYAAGFDAFVQQMTDAVTKKDFSGVDKGVVQMIQNFNILASNKTLPRNASFEEFRTAILSIANNVLLMEGFMNALTEVNNQIIQASGGDTAALDKEVGRSTQKAKADQLEQQDQQQGQPQNAGVEYTTEEQNYAFGNPKLNSAAGGTKENTPAPPPTESKPVPSPDTSSGGDATPQKTEHDEKTGKAEDDHGEDGEEKKKKESNVGKKFDQLMKAFWDYIKKLANEFLDNPNSPMREMMSDGVAARITNDAKNGEGAIGSILGFFHITNGGGMDSDCEDDEELNSLFKSIGVNSANFIDNTMQWFIDSCKSIFGGGGEEQQGQQQQGGEKVNVESVMMEDDAATPPTTGGTTDAPAGSGGFIQGVKNTAQKVANSVKETFQGIKSAAHLTGQFLTGKSIYNALKGVNRDNWMKTIGTVAFKTLGFKELKKSGLRLATYIDNHDWKSLAADPLVKKCLLAIGGITAITLAQVAISENGGIEGLFSKSRVAKLPSPKRATENISASRQAVSPIATQIWNDADAATRNLWQFTNQWLYGGVKGKNGQKTVGMAEIIRQEIASLSQYVNLKDVIQFDTKVEQH